MSPRARDLLDSGFGETLICRILLAKFCRPRLPTEARRRGHTFVDLG